MPLIIHLVQVLLVICEKSVKCKTLQYPKNVGVEFGLEGVELEEVSGEVLGWKGHVVVLGTAGRGLELEKLKSVSGAGRWSESKECQRCLRLELEKPQDSFGVEKRLSPDIIPPLVCCIFEVQEVREWKATEWIHCGAPGCIVELSDLVWGSYVWLWDPGVFLIPIPFPFYQELELAS